MCHQYELNEKRYVRTVNHSVLLTKEDQILVLNKPASILYELLKTHIEGNIPMDFHEISKIFFDKLGEKEKDYSPNFLENIVNEMINRKIVLKSRVRYTRQSDHQHLTH